MQRYVLISDDKYPVLISHDSTVRVTLSNQWSHECSESHRPPRSLRFAAMAYAHGPSLPQTSTVEGRPIQSAHQGLLERR